MIFYNNSYNQLTYLGGIMYHNLKIRVSGQTYPYNGWPRTYRLCYSFFILFTFIFSLSLFAQGTTWTTKTDMPLARESFAISVANDKIYVIGGSSETCSSELATVQEYDPQTDTWSTKSDMPTPRTGLATSVINGKIYAIGGYTYDPYLPVSNVEEYDPDTDTWTPKNDMDVPLTDYSASTIGNRIYIFGGVSDFLENGPEPVSDVWQYNPADDSLTAVSPMPTARTSAHSSVVNETAYVIGGSTTNYPLQPVATVEAYNPLNDPKVTSIEDIFESKNIPTKLVLHQNYPNPFNPTTQISFAIPKPENVIIEVYNTLGQKVETLLNRRLQAGNHEVEFNAANLSSGLYFYRIEAGKFQDVKKMILIR